MSSVLERAALRFGAASSKPALIGIKLFPRQPVLHAPGQQGSDRPRRLLNVVIACVLLLLLAPVMLVVAIVVRLSSEGPIIYKQTRVGLDRRGSDDAFWLGRRTVDYGGRLFTIYKFRTMRADPAAKLQVWAKPNDSRVTSVGRVLRKYRLDELPQLFNVLKGDMNIVGPRPEQPQIFAELRTQIEKYSLRQRVLPGITGWAQINQQYDSSLDDVQRKIKLDLEYLRQRSAWHDLWILLRTVPVILLRKGAW